MICVQCVMEPLIQIVHSAFQTLPLMDPLVNVTHNSTTIHLAKIARVVMQAVVNAQAH